jgi:small subunit ribosomal protein S17
MSETETKTETNLEVNDDRGNRKKLVGNVVSDKMDKSVVVSIESLKKHALYGKYLKRRIKYLAHDENNECKKGDRVSIIECRPMSSRKRWRIEEVMEKAK